MHLPWTLLLGCAMPLMAGNLAAAQVAVPVVERGVCEGEACAAAFPAVAHSAIPVLSSDSDTATIVFYLRHDERVCVLTTNLVHRQLGVAVLRQPYNPVEHAGPDIDFAPGDTVLIAGYRGEGWHGIVHGGQIVDTPAFWPELNRYPFSEDTPARLLRPARTDTWRQVRTASGRMGWVMEHHARLLPDTETYPESRNSPCGPG